MAVTQKIVTSNFNVLNAREFVNTFSTCSYYMYVGNHMPYPGGDSTITTPNNSVQSSLLDVYNNMIFAKKIQEADVASMIPNYAWTSNTVYHEYSHLDGDLINKQFYTVVDDTTEYNVYKCLSNNDGANSTVAPSRVGSSADLNPIITGDNYVWKYMYTITKANYDKFSSVSYVPVTANAAVTAGAVPGTIEVIKILERGAGYNNYIANAVLAVGDINIGGVGTIFGAPESSVGIDDYYQGCVLKLTSGTGIDQYRKIVNYDGTSSQKKFALESPFTLTPAVGDTYEVYPYMFVWGDGTESIPAEARAIIDPLAANSISEIEMLSVGKNYRYGSAYAGETPDTNSVTIDSVYIQLPTVITADPDFEKAQLLPIISPQNGHGSNAYEELFATRVCLSTKFSNTEGGVIPIENDFRQVGIIKNPLFTNVDLKLKMANTISNFSIGETVHQFNQIKVLGNVDINNGNTVVLKTNHGKISTTVQILNSGTGYDNTSNNELVFDNSGTGGSGAAGTFANNGSGEITTITITSQGANYITAPSVTVNPTAATGGSNGQLIINLANPQMPTFNDTFSSGDYILINKSNNNLVATVNSVPSFYQINLTAPSTFTANTAEVSMLELKASGVVTSVTAGQITLSNVSGSFIENSKIIGLSSGATSVIDSVSSIEINDRLTGGFNYGVQLYRLVGDFTFGSSNFEEDEMISQNSLISYAKPRAFLHHADIGGGTDDDILHVTNQFGTFNLDPRGVKTIVGNTSGATLENLSNKYPGDFVKDSGSILYYENIDAITRDGNKSELIKIILEF